MKQFNPAYYERLRQRTRAAGRRGIYVSVMLFEGWGTFHGNRRRGTKDAWAWRSHPFHPDNNSSGIDASDKVKVALGEAKNRFAVEWIHPSTGKAVAGDAVTGGADHEFAAPFDGDAVLYLSRS